ncbi:hypothetical protein RRG08_043870 [Elysia crispata]|uniref:Uncharacterized protein n=1 Tax=Elysia crispata TaxID=231223 RepID=A0AAE0XUF1_9GAST|nr:hypothetical protein RRG08_043870 [Elysia crispata]
MDRDSEVLDKWLSSVHQLSCFVGADTRRAYVQRECCTVWNSSFPENIKITSCLLRQSVAHLTLSSRRANHFSVIKFNKYSQFSKLSKSAATSSCDTRCRY